MKLSIITINYNNASGLRTTLESVASQTNRNFEYIVVDGGSSDGSVDVIKEFEYCIDFWVSEPDAGIYNAMNKGVRHAHGSYCNFLNSGDALYDKYVVDKFNNCDLISDIITGIEFRKSNGKPGSKAIKCYPPNEILTDIFLMSSIGHGSSFINRELLVENPYDESLRIVSDWKFFFEELILNNRSYNAWNVIVNIFDTTGISSCQYEKMMIERRLVLESYLPSKLIDDYLSLIDGRTELNRMINHQRRGGFLEKILQLIGRMVLNLSKFISIWK
jgi:glycosyltransferase involved in cell wall biosynthesis